MDTDWAQPAWLILAVIGLLGACIGSFLTLVTYRLPRDEKIGLTRSRCPKCHTTLRALDLIPILSWVISRGRCRHCKTPVHYRYPLTELACALGAVVITAHYGFTLEAVAITGLWWSMIAMIVTDLEHYIILDEVQIAIGLFGVLYGYAMQVPAADMAIGAVVGAGIGLTLKYGFLYLRNKDGLGMGDVKFLAVAGIWLANPMNFVPFLFFSGVLGVISGLGWRLAGKGEHFPFGPALMLALFLCVTVPSLANGFWNLYGLLLPGSSG